MHFICSGLTFQSYYQALGIKIPDTTKGLLDYAEANVKETSTIQFFWNRETNLISESFKKNGKILELGDIAKKIINMVQPGDILVVTGHSMLIEEVDRKNNKITLLEGSGGRYDFNEHCDKYDKNGAIKRTDAINKINNYFTAGNVPIRICLIRIITDGTSYIDLNNTKKQYNGITPATMTRLKYSNIDIDKTVTISNSTGSENQYLMADLNDCINFQITIKNNSESEYKAFKVIENINSKLTVEKTNGGTLKNNQLSWSVASLKAGETIKFNYSLRVPNNKDLLESVLTFTGKLENMSTPKIEILIGNKLNKEEKSKIKNSFEKLKTNDKIERDFINSIYKDAMNLDLGLTGLKNLDILKYNSAQKTSGGTKLSVKYTELKNTAINKYILQNFYGLRIAENHNAKSSLVAAIEQWNFYPTIEMNDRAKKLESNMFIDGDILLAYTGEKNTQDTKLVNKAYIFIENKLIRKVSKTEFEELSGSKLTEFLRNIVCDNYVLLRPSISITSGIEENINYTVNGKGYATLKEAYDSIETKDGIIIVKKDCVDNSVVEIAKDKNITIDTNGKKIVITKTGIKNNGVLNIKGKGIITTDSSDKNKIRFLLINYGTLNVSEATIINTGIATNNSYTIFVSSGTLNLKGGEIKSYSPKDSKYFDAPLNVKGTANITGGKIIGTTYGIYSFSSAPKINISGGEITSEDNAIIITGENAKGTLNITGGTIISSQASAIMNEGSANINIGKNDGKVSTNTPIVQGLKSAINTITKFNFWDGVLKAQEKLYIGKVSVAEGYKEKSTTEEIQGKKYKVTRLEKEPITSNNNNTSNNNTSNNNTSNNNTSNNNTSNNNTSNNNTSNNNTSNNNTSNNNTSNNNTSNNNTSNNNTSNNNTSNNNTSNNNTSNNNTSSNNTSNNNTSNNNTSSNNTSNNNTSNNNTSNNNTSNNNNTSSNNTSNNNTSNNNTTQSSNSSSNNNSTQSSGGGSSSNNSNNFDKQFIDIKPEDWYYDSVEYVYKNGIFKGIQENTFGPNRFMNRAMVVTALHRLDGEKKYKNIINFIDVSKDAYYEKALYWAAEKKIITGTSENTFSPELNVTREQLVTILYRYADYKNKSISVGKQTDLSKFQDFEEISEYAVVPMKWAYSKGIINGRTENEIAPKGTATRAEVATIIMRFNKKIK